MPFLPVILWTDSLIYLLLAVFVASVFYIRQRPHLITPWQAVIKRKRGMMSIMILLVYVIVGLLDSIHFRPALGPDDNGNQHYSSEVLTVLDVALMPLRQHVEKTYSSPLATRLFVREMIESDQGKLDYDYPKLTYAGSHLASEQNKWADISSTLIDTSLLVLLIWLGWLLLLVLIFARWRQLSFTEAGLGILSGKSDYPIKTGLITLLIIGLFGSNLMTLSVDYHVFGTDKVGQDVLYQTLKSVRTGLVIGTLTTLVMLPLALLMGISAGYFKGWIDDLIQYIYTTLNSIPGVLLIAAAVLMLQVYMNNHPENFVTVAERADMRLLFLCIILGMTSWTGLCRILRGETLKLRESDYVLAARALGAGSFTILHRHILPNLMHIVMIAIVLDFSGLVLAEAVLSYVGVGVDPSMISWGNMINSARLEMAREPIVWWSLTAAFVSMFVLVLAANLFADVVRDAFDPRMQGIK
ncbi:MAG: ABC transporter permease [Gammaproteobacteria bacterium]|nr:ABC transporter permease [Gammaproteobacteria bacterium]